MGSWASHARAFCCDLGLCDDSVGGEYWGANNADPSKLSAAIDYFFSKGDSLDTMGKGMLIAFACASACRILLQRSLTEQESISLHSILAVARSDVELASYVWYFVDDDDSTEVFTAWLLFAFPGWHPRHWP
jgi:hypothetical protein